MTYFTAALEYRLFYETVAFKIEDYFSKKINELFSQHIVYNINASLLKLSWNFAADAITPTGPQPYEACSTEMKCFQS